MAALIGLDVGTMAVRAAEVSLQDQAPTLEHFGQVALPYGAVRNGEVVDVGAVGEAIQRLWDQTGFRSKKVVLGMANQRVFVRQAELPAMAENEIRSALQFEAQEFIPIPIEDVELDFRVLDHVTGSDGEPKVRILIAAAQKDMVNNLIAAAELAGLRVMRVDLVPFALVRALSPLSYDLAGGTSNAEAIVSVGAGITNVVVHEQGIPRFVRILSMGGNSVTEAIAEQLDVDMDTAEELKRYSYMRPSDPRSIKVGEIVESQVRPLLQEIQGSLQFYASQADSSPLARILVAGGGSLTPGLFDQLVSQNEVPVQPALILGSLHLGRTGLSEQDLTRSEPVMAVPLGLAYGAHDPTAISLLPAHLAKRANLPAQMAVAAGICLVFLVLLLLLWHGKESALNAANARASQEQAQAQDEKAKIPSSESTTVIQNQNTQAEATIKSVLAGDIDWVSLLAQFAQVMPQDTWVTSIQLSSNAGTSGSTTTASSASAGTSDIGKASFSVVGVDFTSAAQWMQQFSSDFPDFDSMWLGAISEASISEQYLPASGSSSSSSSSSGSSSSSSSSGGSSSSQSSQTFGATAPNTDSEGDLCFIPGQCIVNFSATANITSASVSQRVICYTGAEGFATPGCPYEDLTGNQLNSQSGQNADGAGS